MSFKKGDRVVILYSDYTSGLGIVGEAGTVIECLTEYSCHYIVRLNISGWYHRLYPTEVTQLVESDDDLYV